MREPPIPDGRECCLFLDIDGTLLDIAPTPDSVQVDEALRSLLRRLGYACNGALALISGRTISNIDDLFAPLLLPAAGVHGNERRDARGYWHHEAVRGPAFEEFRERMSAALAPLAGILVEDKGCGVALHYRLVPNMHAPLRKAIERLTPWLPETHAILEGDEVIEIKPVAHDKGTAIDAFMREAPFARRYPIFIGDDLTDRDGFEAVRKWGGLAIAVGSNVHADEHLDNPRAVRRWLSTFLEARVAA